jgi:hypothetical protein
MSSTDGQQVKFKISVQVKIRGNHQDNESPIQAKTEKVGSIKALDSLKQPIADTTTNMAMGSEGPRMVRKCNILPYNHGNLQVRVNRDGQQPQFVDWIELYGGATKPKEVSITYLQFGQTPKSTKFKCGAIETP